MKMIVAMRGLLGAGAGVLALTLAFGSAAKAAPDALPNWNGLWVHDGGLMFDPTVDKYGKPEAPPLTPQYQKMFQDNLALRAKGDQVLDPTSKCLPPGMPRMMIMVFPMEIFQTPGQVTIFGEWASQVRRIYTDGRQHPKDLEPTFNGHSIGHWEGDTLVVDTVGIREDTSIDSSPLQHTGQIHIAERIHLVSPTVLEDQITLTDPGVFATPWTSARRYHRDPAATIMDYACEGRIQ